MDVDPGARHDRQQRDGHRPQQRVKTTNVSLAGKATVEETKSRQVEFADGRKAGIESTTTKEAGLGGASKTETVTKQAFDGSSTSTTHKKGIERGDGKIAATTSRSVPRPTRRATR